MDVFHYSNLGEISWYLFAKKIVELSKKKCIIKPISSANYKQIAYRPNYTVLSHHKIARLIKDNLKEWEDSIHHFNKKLFILNGSLEIKKNIINSTYIQ